MHIFLFVAGHTSIGLFQCCHDPCFKFQHRSWQVDLSLERVKMYESREGIDPSYIKWREPV